MIVVVGSTGVLGGEICGQLVKSGKGVRALVRATSSAEKTDALKKQGAELVTGDLKDPGSLSAACSGVDTVISTASSTMSRQEGDSIETVDRKGQLSLIEAAKKAGVGRFIFVSFPHGEEPSCPLEAAKMEVEGILASSGMTYTIIYANVFMEVWLSPALGFDYANAKATIYGDGKAGIAWVYNRA